MAHMSQETKANIVAALKPIMAKYGVKATYSVRNHTALSVNIKSGKIDFITNYIETDKNKHYGQPMSQDQVNYILKNQCLDVNQYWFQDHFTGKAKQFLAEVIKAIKTAGKYFDESDAQTDYFHCAFYYNIHVGSWNKPYQVV